jgi:hypothetical protein
MGHDIVVIWDGRVLPFLLEYDHLIISRSEFDRFPWDERVSKIVLLGELQWDGEFAVNMHGLKIVQEIRFLHRVKAPLFFCTYLPSTTVFHLYPEIIGLMETPCHYFVGLPSSPLSSDHWLSAPPLTDLLLEEIVFLYLNPEGIFNAIWASMRSCLLPLKIRDFEIAQSKLFKIAHSEKHGILHELCKRQTREIQAAAAEKRAASFEAFKKEFLDVILHQVRNRNLRSDRQRPWITLYVDSDPTSHAQMKRRLDLEGLACLAATDAPEAFDLLSQDIEGRLRAAQGHLLPPNSIMVVVVCQRLTAASGKWETVQGFDLLWSIANQLKNMVALFALLEAKNSAFHLLQNRVRVLGFAKGDVVSEGDSPGFKFFVNQLQLEGDKIAAAQLSAPRAGFWNKVYKNKVEIPLSEFYKMHRQSTDYEKNEAWINEVAQAYCRQARKYQELDLRVPIEGMRLVLKTEIKTRDEKSFEKFLHKLIARRIALAMHKYGWENDDIAALLMTKSYWDYPDLSQVRALFTIHLSLSSDLSLDIPHFILVEERIFLEQLGFAMFHKEMFPDDDA